jgi:hypothetical protein
MKTLHEDVAVLSDTTPFFHSTGHIASACDKVHWVQSNQYNGEPSHVMLHESGCLTVPYCKRRRMPSCITKERERKKKADKEKQATACRSMSPGVSQSISNGQCLWATWSLAQSDSITMNFAVHLISI